MFSQTSEYALRAVIWLAEHQNEGPVGNKRIAEDTQVPASYLSKILHDLAAAGFLSSRRGVGGGFRLIIPPNELTMLDVVNAVDPLKRSKGSTDSSYPSCPMSQKLDRAVHLVEDTLRSARICDLIPRRVPEPATPPSNQIPLAPPEEPIRVMQEDSLTAVVAT